MNETMSVVTTTAVMQQDLVVCGHATRGAHRESPRLTPLPARSRHAGRTDPRWDPFPVGRLSRPAKGRRRSCSGDHCLFPSSALAFGVYQSLRGPRDLFLRLRSFLRACRNSSLNTAPSDG